VLNHPAHENDHRPIGDYGSRYTSAAWFQIVIELVVLLTYIGLAIAGVACAVHLKIAKPHTAFGPSATLESFVASTSPWGSMFFSALAGGAIFATKWLYHSVAKGEWNRDRILWRFIAPINSAVLATAAGFGIIGGHHALSGPKFLR
jgi:hypothetical protein